MQSHSVLSCSSACVGQSLRKSLGQRGTGLHPMFCRNRPLCVSSRLVPLSVPILFSLLLSLSLSFLSLSCSLALSLYISPSSLFQRERETLEREAATALRDIYHVDRRQAQCQRERKRQHVLCLSCKAVGKEGAGQKWQTRAKHDLRQSSDARLQQQAQCGGCDDGSQARRQTHIRRRHCLYGNMLRALVRVFDAGVNFSAGGKPKLSPEELHECIELLELHVTRWPNESLVCLWEKQIEGLVSQCLSEISPACIQGFWATLTRSMPTPPPPPPQKKNCLTRMASWRGLGWMRDKGIGEAVGYPEHSLVLGWWDGFW